MPSVVRLAARGDTGSNSSSTMPHLSSLVIVSSLCGIIVLGAALCYLNRYFRRLVRRKTREREGLSNAQKLGVAQLPGSTISLPQRAMLAVPSLSRDTSYETSTRALVQLLEPPSGCCRTASPAFRVSFTPPSKHSSYASTVDGDAGVLSYFPQPPHKRLSSSPSLPQLQGQTRIVRQKFTPLLPDELLLGKVGEKLTIIKPFDDSWCLVSRKDYSALDISRDASRLAVRGDHLGVVPAWCFVEPAAQGHKGHKPQRPVRRSSAGISEEMDVQFAMEKGSRGSKGLSWSDF